MRFGVPFLRRGRVQFRRSLVATGNPAAFLVQAAEVVLGHGAALLGGLGVPLGCQFVVRGKTAPLFVHQREVALRTSVAFLGRPEIPLAGLGVVLSDPAAVVIETTDAVLSLGVPAFGQRKPLSQRLGIIAAIVRGQTELVVPAGGQDQSRDQQQGAKRTFHRVSPIV